MTNDELWAKLGTLKNEVKILPYDPAWPRLFDQERNRILQVCSPFPLMAIEHIGSTSISGLAAKPIIDIMLGVKDMANSQQYVEPLATLGYESLGDYGIPGRLFFVLAQNGRNLFHCHMFQHLSWQWCRHLHFRDYLRQHPAKADEYLNLKRKLAQEYQYDRHNYSEHKTPFIAEIEKYFRS